MADHEEAFETSIREGLTKWKGVIIYSTAQYQFVYMPLEGFVGGSALDVLSKVDLDRTDLTRADRLEAFELKLPGEEYGNDAYIFLRVEEGCEDEFIDGVESYLNYQLKAVNLPDRIGKYKQMIWPCRDILFPIHKYMVRDMKNPVWAWEMRKTYGDEIKYHDDVVVGAAHHRVRLGPGSVASSYAGSVSAGDVHDIEADDDNEEAGEDRDSTGDKGTSAEKETPAQSAAQHDKDDQVVEENVEKTGAEKRATDKSQTEEQSQVRDETDEQAEVRDEADPSDEPSGQTAKKVADKVEVSEAEIEAQMENVDIPSELAPKLAALYKELPPTDKFPDPKKDIEDFKNMVVKLRPFENAQLASVNKKKLPAITVNKDWSDRIIARERNRITEILKDRDRHEQGLADKRHAAAKRKALAKKRADMKAEEKNKEKAEKQAKEMAAKEAKQKAEMAAKEKAEKEAKDKAAKDKAAKDKAAKDKAAKDKAAKEANQKKKKKDSRPEPNIDDEMSFVRAVLTAESDEETLGKDKRKPYTPTLLRKLDVPTGEPDRTSVRASAETESLVESSNNEGGEDQAGSVEELQDEQDQDDDEEEEEVIEKHTSKSRTQKAPEPVDLPRVPKAKRTGKFEGIPVDVAAGILTTVRDLFKEVASIHKEQTRQDNLVTTNLKKIGQNMKLMAENMDKMSLKLYKQDMANELVIADAERKATKLLPLAKLDTASDLLLDNEVTSKVIAEYCMMVLDAENYKEPTLSDVIIESAKVVFSEKLRAFMYLPSRSASDTDEARKGWDRSPVPDGFIKIVETYLLKLWRQQGGKRTPIKGANKKLRSWEEILAGHLRGRREAYFSYLALPFDNAYDMVVERYQKKVEVHELNYNPDREKRLVRVPSMEQELQWYAEQISVADVDALRDVVVTNKRKKFPNPTGEPFDLDKVKKVIDNLNNVRYGVPSYAASAINVEAEGEVPEPGPIIEGYQKELKRKRGLDAYGLSALVNDDDDDVDEEDVDDPELGDDDVFEGPSSGGRGRKRGDKSPGNESPTKKQRTRGGRK